MTMRARPVREELGISSWLVRAPLLELEGRGHDGAPLLGRHGIDRRDVFDPDAWIPLRSYAPWYRAAVQASGDPGFAVAAGRRIPIKDARAAGIAAATAATLFEACETLGRYNRLLRDGSRLGARRTARFDAVTTRRPPAFPVHDDLPALAIGIHDFFEYATGRTIRATEVLLTGPVTPTRAVLQKAMGAPVSCGAAEFEIRFERGALDAPVAGADAALRERLEEIARLELVMRTGASTADRVHAAILRTSFDGNPAMSHVASALGLTARTMQRRLGEDGQTFAGIRERTLREEALRLLVEQDGPVEEVALRLGFSSRGGFHRAIRRWTGMTAGQVRSGRPSPNVRAPRSPRPEARGG